jgi:hypothetical protein
VLKIDLLQLRQLGTIEGSVILLHRFLLAVFPLIPPIPILAAAMFNWQAEISSTATLSSAARVQPSPKPATSNVVSFAQALSASHNVSSNDNLPQPSIRGEAVYIKISQDMYEKGMATCM